MHCKQAKQRYGSKILTSDAPVEHSSKGKKFVLNSSHDPSNSLPTVDGSRAAVGENWLLGQADYFVISAYSGFGRTAAFRSLRQHSIFSGTPDGQHPELNSDCSDPHRFLSHYANSLVWSGICAGCQPKDVLHIREFDRAAFLGPLLLGIIADVACQIGMSMQGGFSCVLTCEIALQDRPEGSMQEDECCLMPMACAVTA